MKGRNFSINLVNIILSGNTFHHQFAVFDGEKQNRICKSLQAESNADAA
jgi:hypothetical protein